MSDAQLLLWLTGIHLVGLICVALLVLPVLRDDPEPPPEQEGGGSDDGWGNLPTDRPRDRGWPGGGLPLPDAVPSRVRLREPGRISESIPGPSRRPVREPERQPARVIR